MTSLPKNPFQAHIATEFGGSSFKRARTLDSAILKAETDNVPGTKIVRRWVTDTKGNVLWEAS